MILVPVTGSSEFVLQKVLQKKKMKKMAVVFRLLFMVLIILTSSDIEWCRGARRRQRKCHDESLETRENLADIIFTGTVVKTHRDLVPRGRGPRSASKGTYKAEIQIKRLMKGDLSFNNQVVLVDGFGNPRVCHSNVKERDTRIFMVNEILHSNYSHPILKLNSSMVRVTIQNLEKTIAAVRGKVRLFQLHIRS